MVSGEIFTKTLTDTKKSSKRGRLALTKDFETIRLDKLEGRENLLKPVFRDGRLIREVSFDDIRQNTIKELF